MQLLFSSDELINIQKSMLETGGEITQLRQEVTRLTAEVERLTCENERLKKQSAMPGIEAKASTGYILMEIDVICKILKNLRGSKLVGSLYLALRKMMPQDVAPDAIRRITDSAELEPVPNTVSINAEGPVNVAGNLNHVHDNNQVTFS